MKGFKMKYKILLGVAIATVVISGCASSGLKAQVQQNIQTWDKMMDGNEYRGVGLDTTDFYNPEVDNNKAFDEIVKESDVVIKNKKGK